MLEVPDGPLHIVPVQHEDIAWDMVLRHLRTFAGRTLLFCFPDSDVYRGFSHGSVLGSPSNMRAARTAYARPFPILSFHSIGTLPLRSLGKSVTHVSGTFCHPCLVTLSLRRYP